MALTGEEKLIYSVILIALLAAVMYIEFGHLRKKSREAKSKSYKRDEAYNAIHTARAVMNVLQRQGKDTRAADSLLTKAKAAMVRGDYDSCIQYCESAKDELTKAKMKAPMAELEAPGEEEDGLELVGQRRVAGGRSVPQDDTYVGTKLRVEGDPSYLSAKFELSTARGDVAKAEASGKEVSRAKDLLTQAENEFAAGRYSKALSLSIRAKKEVGAEQDATIPLKKEPEAVPEIRPVKQIEISREAGECKECGGPLEPEDLFCAKCGAKVPKDRTCPVCGNKPMDSDLFCRKCGARL